MSPWGDRSLPWVGIVIVSGVTPLVLFNLCIRVVIVREDACVYNMIFSCEDLQKVVIYSVIIKF